MYIPTTGRFLQQDPEGYIDGPNRYQLELSSPVDRLDPTGLDATTQPTGPVGPTGIPIYTTPVAPGWAARRDDLYRQLLQSSPELENNPLYQQQCQELATRIANAVASQPKQTGGALGNWARYWSGAKGNECGDWQNLLNKAIQPFVDKYGKQLLLKILDQSAHLQNPVKNNDHQWVQVDGSMVGVIVDPWPSGGDKLVDPSYTNGNNWTTITPTPILPSGPTHDPKHPPTTGK